MEELKKLLTHEDELISGAAVIVVALLEDAKNGGITKDELEELVGDITNLEEINELANSIERKAKVAAAFDIIKDAVSAISFV